MQMSILKPLVMVGGGLLIAALLAYAAWSWIYPSYTYRYRMTVEVEADGKIYSGSSVIQVTHEVPPEWLLSSKAVSHVEGEAIFVDLGAGRNVIALLAEGKNASNVDYPQYIVRRLFGLTYSHQDLPKVSRLQGSREIPVDSLPTLITFSNLNDPKTARVVQPHELSDVFGEGVKFRNATVEITRDAVTRSIEKKMPVIIAELREQAKVSRIERLGDPFRVNSGHFERGR